MTDSGHNIDGAVAADQLAAYIRRIENLEGEIAALNEDKREVYAEAKACGFDRRIMRQVINRRKRSRDELREEEQLLELYERALQRLNETDEGADPLE